MINSIAIIGAGLMGRLIALSLHRQGFKVTLFDKGNKAAQTSAAYAAAGLLTPLGEAPQCEENIVKMGFESLKLWPAFLSTLSQKTFFQQTGSILINHEQDQGDYQRFDRYIKTYYPDHAQQNLTHEQLLHLEPELARTFKQGIYLPDEGQIDNRALLSALQKQLEDEKITWHEHTYIDNIIPQKKQCLITINKANNVDTIAFDHAIDCRGIGAKKAGKIPDTSRLNDLRAVRGELFQLYAPEVNLTRPIRLMHPRYQLYIAPKPNNYYAVGATQIESDDSSAMTVRSALELLSAAYSVHSGFAEANIVEHISQRRPAFSNNQPKILANRSLTQVNGLYRHGYLISPVVTAQVVELINNLKSSKPIETPCQYSDLLPITCLNTNHHLCETI